jgi:hypothetical protein
MGIEYVLETLEPRIASIPERRRRAGLIMTRHLPNEQRKAVTVSVDGGSSKYPPAEPGALG